MKLKLCSQLSTPRARALTKNSIKVYHIRPIVKSRFPPKVLESQGTLKEKMKTIFVIIWIFVKPGEGSWEEFIPKCEENAKALIQPSQGNTGCENHLMTSTEATINAEPDQEVRLILLVNSHQNMAGEQLNSHQSPRDKEKLQSTTYNTVDKKIKQNNKFLKYHKQMALRTLSTKKTVSINEAKVALQELDTKNLEIIKISNILNIPINSVKNLIPNNSVVMIDLEYRPFNSYECQLKRVIEILNLNCYQTFETLNKNYFLHSLT